MLAFGFIEEVKTIVIYLKPTVTNEKKKKKKLKMEIMNFSQEIRLKSKCYTRDSLEILTGTSTSISQLFDFGTCLLTFFFKLLKAPNGF